MDDACFVQTTGYLQANCTSKRLNPASSAMTAAVKSGMRQPACTSTYTWYTQSFNTTPFKFLYTTTLTDTKSTQYANFDWGVDSTYPPGITTVTVESPAPTSASSTACCGQCMIHGSMWMCTIGQKLTRTTLVSVLLAHRLLRIKQQQRLTAKEPSTGLTPQTDGTFMLQRELLPALSPSMELR